MTGSLDDGTAGLLSIKARGGLAVIQDPDEALYSGMPRSALENVKIDFKLPLAEIPALLGRLARKPVSEEKRFQVNEELKKEVESAKFNLEVFQDDFKPASPSPFGCPECGGVLWEMKEEGILRFRCRVGHALSSESLLASQSGALEDALWTALKTLEENVTLVRRLADQAGQRNQTWLASRFLSKVQEAEDRANLIRSVLLIDETTSLISQKEETPDEPASAMGA